MSEPVVISSGELTATISPIGAELVSLRDAGAREYMSDGDPRWWSGRAPVLFPVVGALNGDRYRLDGKEYSLGKHGFARRSMFTLEEHDPCERVRFVLSDSEATRAVFPFAFRLELFHSIRGATLMTTATVSNTGDAPLPFSFGFHPAFAATESEAHLARQRLDRIRARRGIGLGERERELPALVSQYEIVVGMTAAVFHANAAIGGIDLAVEGDFDFLANLGAGRADADAFQLGGLSGHGKGEQGQ